MAESNSRNVTAPIQRPKPFSEKLETPTEDSRQRERQRQGPASPKEVPPRG